MLCRISPRSRHRFARRQREVIDDVTAPRLITKIIRQLKPLLFVIRVLSGRRFRGGGGPWVTLRSPTAKSLRLTPPGSRLPDDMAADVCNRSVVNVTDNQMVINEIYLGLWGVW